MSIWLVILLITLAIHPLAYLLLGIIAVIPRRKSNSSSKPKATLLIKARDEASHIGACLESLTKQTEFPSLDLILVDDGSSDETRTIMSRMSNNRTTIIAIHHPWTEDAILRNDAREAQINPRFFYYDAREFLPELLGRQRAVAAAFYHAKTDAVIMTDADCTFPPGWIASHLRHLENYSLVCGFVDFCPGKRKFFDHIVAVESMLLQVASAAAFRLNSPGGAMGGNLSLRLDAYRAVGGFENLGPTNTEDAQLTLAIAAKHRVSYNMDTAGVVAHHDRLGVWRFIKQRAFWLVGGAEVTPFWLLAPLILAIDALAPWIALTLSLFNILSWEWTVLGFAGKLLGDSGSWLAVRHLDRRIKPWHLVLAWFFEVIYIPLLPVITLPGMWRAFRSHLQGKNRV